MSVCGLFPHAIREVYILVSDVGHSLLRPSRPYFSWGQTDGVSCTERDGRDIEQDTVGEGHACGRGPGSLSVTCLNCRARHAVPEAGVCMYACDASRPEAGADRREERNRMWPIMSRGWRGGAESATGARREDGHTCACAFIRSPQNACEQKSMRAIPYDTFDILIGGASCAREGGFAPVVAGVCRLGL